MAQSTEISVQSVALKQGDTVVEKQLKVRRQEGRRAGDRPHLLSQHWTRETGHASSHSSGPIH